MNKTLIYTLALLAACTSGGTDGEDSDSDTDPDANTVMMTGTMTTPASAILPTGDVTVGLMHISPDDDGMGMGDILVAANNGPLSDGAALDWYFPWPDVPADDQFESMDEGSPDEEIALYMPVAWVDANTDGAFDPGETVVGASLTFLAYARGDLSQDTLDAGAEVDQWHKVIMDFTASDPDGPEAITVIDADHSVALEANLLPLSQGALAFGITDAWGVQATLVLQNVGAFDPATTIAEPGLGTTTADATNAGATGSFDAATFAGPPPADHFSDDFGDQQIGNIAMYMPFAFSDIDDDGQLDIATEPPLGGADNAMVAYVEPTSFDAAFMVDVVGWNMGWMLMPNDDDGDDDTGGKSEEEGPPPPIAWSEGLQFATWVSDDD
jgi:hypothetical protein